MRWNWKSYFLSGSGVGSLTLIDDDVVELSNLNRQVFFDESSVGRKKIHILSDSIKSRNKNIKVDTIEMKIESPSDLESIPPCDLIVVSADHPMTIMDWVNEYGIKHGIPFINVGYIGDVAIFGPLVIPGHTGCFRCGNLATDFRKGFNKYEHEIEEINTGSQEASAGTINAIAAAMAANDCLRFLGKFEQPESLNKRIGIWTKNLEVQKINSEQNPDCRVCSVIH